MSTFTLSLKLNTSASDEAVLMERFYQGFLMYNRLVSHARKRLRGLRQDKRYRAAMDTYRKGERGNGRKKNFLPSVWNTACPNTSSTAGSPYSRKRGNGIWIP